MPSYEYTNELMYLRFPRRAHADASPAAGQRARSEQAARTDTSRDLRNDHYTQNVTNNVVVLTEDRARELQEGLK